MLHGFDEALRLGYLLLRILQGFLVGTRHALLVRAVGVNHLGKRIADFQVRHVAIVNLEGHRAVVVGVYDEVGRHLVLSHSHRVAHRRPRFRRQLGQFPEQRCALEVGQLHGSTDFVPVFLGEFVEMVLDHGRHEVLEPACGTSLNLKEQTFLQVSCADARGVEALEFMQHAFHGLLVHVDVMIDGQFVSNGAEILAQQSVVVQ